jgi:hypothetical protein
MRTLRTVSLGLWFTVMGSAQTPDPDAGARVAKYLDKLAAIREAHAGRVELQLEPHDGGIVSLGQALRVCRLIIDGTVTTVLPSIDRHPRVPPSIETRSIVSVSEVLYGGLPAPAEASRTLTLVQEGGKAGKWDVAPIEDPLVKAGERYVLFLVGDPRPTSSDDPAAPRYITVGIYAGKAKLDGGKVGFLPAAAPELHQYDGKDASEFLTMLREKIAIELPPNRMEVSGEEFLRIFRK